MSFNIYYMKKFTILTEQTSTKKFKIIVELELVISAENEGEAGYISDSILSGMENQENYTITDISEIKETI